MSGITTMFEAQLGDATELTTAHELTRSPDACGRTPRWWAVDVGVRARLLDTTAQGVPRPRTADVLGPDFGHVAPLHLRIDAGLIDDRSSSRRSWLVDATSLRAFVFASTVLVSLVGPSSLAPYFDGDPLSVSVSLSLSQKAPRDLLAQVSAGIWGIEHPGSAARSCSCTLRVRVAAHQLDVAVPVPPGARTLTIHDSAGSSAPWAWRLGAAPGELVGRIPMVDGQSRSTVPVPHATHVAPAQAIDQPRDVLLTFGVDL